MTLTMDSAEEADEVRASAERIRKKKRPLNAEDFKGLASELVSQLHHQIASARNYDASSPQKSCQSAAAAVRPRRTRKRAPEPADDVVSLRSKGGSICSTVATPRMKSIFERQIKAMTIPAIKKQCTDAGIEWTPNNFRDLDQKALIISKLAAYMATQAVQDLKAASM